MSAYDIRGERVRIAGQGGSARSVITRSSTGLVFGTRRLQLVATRQSEADRAPASISSNANQHSADAQATVRP
ncbi:hypothetical protein E0H22_09210 [Rhodopseudomonas boonkerdii]|uniref:hypothetical protein n=1 Tax=Rhodopseudomonas boonkerdii TaxID=475937 RepID=UPI001E510E37|nr:hypothetical protein [Rhodopseudomonas boonkerdii]UGV25848.1 hypothetical protein E0H22_09210 [Rhodopseudomonas boonkerdii]